MAESLSGMEYLCVMRVGVRVGGGENTVVLFEQKNKKKLSWLLCVQSLLPDALFGLVGIAGCDGADVVHHALLLHGEVVGGLGEDRRLVHIQHPDDHLFVQMQNATVERASLAASHGFSWFYVVMHRHQYQYWY